MAEKGEKVLKCIWKVENFSYCWNETDDFLQSPEFCYDYDCGMHWRLKLYPKGRSSYENYVSAYLELIFSEAEPLGITADFEMALLRPDGTTEHVKEMKDRCFREGNKYGFDNLVSRERLFGPKKLILLPKDVLTLQCRIFPKNAELEAYTEIIAKTYIEIQCYRRQWKDIDYTRNNSISLRGDMQLGDMCFELRLSRESNSQYSVLTGQIFIDTDLKSLHCNIGIMDLNDSVVKLLVNDKFDTENILEDYLKFPLITEPELLENPSQYLPNGKLNLDCEFTVCTGLKLSDIEGIAENATFMPLPVDETESASQKNVPPKKFLYCIDNVPSSLKNDFQNLYQEGTLCDFTIKVGEKDFKVHKAVLCARSPVFKAMLTSNMKENGKNMVDISDLEEDTVCRMLTFIYSDTAGNLDWDTAKKLYFAADKYCLITLRRISSEVLYQNLSVTDVREVLTLANMHADEYLKKKTVKFICDNETEVMHSTEWKTFMTEDVNLAADTMHQIILEKAECQY